MTRNDRPSKPYRLALRSVVLLAASLTALSACETMQQRVDRKEDALAAAGFVVKPANTPAREAMLHRLPPNKFVQRVKGDTVRYVYADPIVCNCLYVGNQRAYDTLKEHEREQGLADEQLMSAQTYADGAWDWGAWGPWGPGFFFGPGFGW